MEQSRAGREARRPVSTSAAWSKNRYKKSRGFSRRDFVCGRGQGGGRARARPRSPPPREAPRRPATRHACAAPRLTRRRLAGSSPASESDPPSRSPGQRQREDCLRHLGRQRHPSPCDPNRPSVGPSLYIKEASSGGVDRRVHGVLS